ncbi:MAG: hypothetical protein E6G05_10550 [Actinobacteria bacterium]|nr:MAG: hypothetical protein E6G05_10550 [Actinomycetota bacterium]
MAQGGTSASLVLIAIGAILRWAVTAQVSGLSLPTVGLVLIIVGILGFVVSLLELFMWAPRRERREPSRHPQDYDATHRLS